jgi:hypothetical protein
MYTLGMSSEKMCTKFRYATEADAIAFSKSWASRNTNAALQFPYRCEECPSCYHLSCKPRDSYSLSRPRQMTNFIRTGSSRDDVAIRRSKVEQQHKLGKNGSQIAAATGIPKHTVYSDLNVLNARRPKPPAVTLISPKIEFVRQQEADALLADAHELVAKLTAYLAAPAL